VTRPAPVEIHLPITVGQFVKAAGFAQTGGDAKNLIGSGLVRVNNNVETRRGHKLNPGDIVEVGDSKAEVVPATPWPPPIVGGQS
jgi:ribosome-associated protein